MTFARGKKTAERLREAGITRFSEAADLAFILGEGDGQAGGEHFELPPGDGPVIGVAPSQVLSGQLSRRGIAAAPLIAGALDRLIDETGGRAVLIAHSWLGPDKRSRNNDYHICLEVLERMRRRERAVFVDRDLSAYALRRVIKGFDAFIACRFHAMISSLCEGVPCAVPAWSHKYGEVMDEFGLGSHVLGLTGLTEEKLAGAVLDILKEKESIERAIEGSLTRVRESAESQIRYVAALLEDTGTSVTVGGAARRLYGDIYKETFRGAWTGYGSSPEVRDGAASGGLVSALLAEMLESGAIDGAITARTRAGDGGLGFETVLCRTRDEILDCRTSIYSDFNHAAGVIRILRSTPGRFAVVALPCQWSWITKWTESGAQAEGAIALKVGLWCGHATHRRLAGDFLALRRIDPGEIDRFWYRKGLWRGSTVILMKDGREVRIPFKSGYGLLQNLYVDCMGRCLSCEDHFAADSDISFGDAWLAEMKGHGIKHSMAVSLTRRGEEAAGALSRGSEARMTPVPPVLAVQSQKRAVIWHTHGTAGRARVAGLFGARVRASGRYAVRWNDILSALMILGARRAFGGRMRRLLLKMPWPLHYIYMLLQKFFLNF